MASSRIALEGLPHSEIFGSKPVCGSPKLIAAYHVLHRRPAPRHPPYALSSLTTTFTLLENTVVFVRLSLRAFKNKDLRLSMSRGLERPAAASASDTTARPSPKGRTSAGVPRLARVELVELTGIEPATSALQTGALPAELQPRGVGPRVVGLSGFEPLTSRLSAVRSSQLSYRPVAATDQARGTSSAVGLEESGLPKSDRPARRAGRVAP